MTVPGYVPTIGDDLPKVTRSVRNLYENGVGKADVIREASVELQSSHACAGKLVLVTDNFGGKILLGGTSGTTGFRQCYIKNLSTHHYIFDNVLDNDDGQHHNTSSTVWTDGAQGTQLSSNKFYYVYAFYAADETDIQLSFRTPGSSTGYPSFNSDGITVCIDHPNERHIGMIYTKGGDVTWIGDNGQAHTQSLVRGVLSEQLLPQQTAQVVTSTSSHSTWVDLGCSARVAYSGASKLPTFTLSANYKNTVAGALGQVAIVGNGFQVNGGAAGTLQIDPTNSVYPGHISGSIAKTTCPTAGGYSHFMTQLSQAWEDGYLECTAYGWTDTGTATFEVDILTTCWQ